MPDLFQTFVFFILLFAIRTSRTVSVAKLRIDFLEKKLSALESEILLQKKRNILEKKTLEKKEDVGSEVLKTPNAFSSVVSMEPNSAHPVERSHISPTYSDSKHPISPSDLDTSQSITPVRKKSERSGSSFFKKAETFISENLTGFIGSLTLTFGVIFLGIYSSISLEPSGRFGVICLFSVGLYGLYAFLNRKTFWKKVSLWIRSASGTLFLMGCLGSGGIEAIKWIDNPILALSLLCFGLLTNLIFGFLNGGQLFASLHVTLSFLSLGLVEVNSTVLAIAAIIALIGLTIGYREKNWDRHILAVNLGFSSLHAYWLFGSLFHETPMPVSPIVSIASIAAIGIVSLVYHLKREPYPDLAYDTSFHLDFTRRKPLDSFFKV